MSIEPAWAFAGTLGAAVIGGILALRTKIQASAWEKLYDQKKEEIELFVRLLSEFGQRIWILGEVRDTKGLTWGQQGRGLDYWKGLLWGRESEHFAAKLADRIFAEVPSPPTAEALFEPPPEEVEEAFDRVRMVTANLILEDLSQIQFHLHQVQDTLLLKARNPNPIQRAAAEVNRHYARLTGRSDGWQVFAYESFPDEYAKATGPVRLALRRDLRISSRSLGALTRTSWLWMLARLVRSPRRFVRDRWRVYVARDTLYAPGTEAELPMRSETERERDD